MKITDTELSVHKIVDVRNGHLTKGRRQCLSRRSDSFVIILSGTSEYSFDGRIYTANSGDVIFLSYQSKYLMNVCSEDYSFIYVDFFFERGSVASLDNVIYKSSRLSDTEADFKRLYNLWKIGDYADKLYCKALVYKIYSKIAKSDMTQYISGKRKNDIEKVAKYMAEHLSDVDLSVSELSKVCNVSEVHFRRLFNCVYHTSPTKFLISLRIKKATELLTEKNYAISEISDLCGFQNHYYFSKVFKSITSMTPTEYRKRCSDFL